MKNATFLSRDKVIQLMQLAKLELYNDLLKSIDLIIENSIQENRDAYTIAYTKLGSFVKGVINGKFAPQNSIFVEGNAKLPFLSFSNAPIVNCMGMGECEQFCYSLRALRYPSAQTRLIQNTILMNSPAGQEIIFNSLKKWTQKTKYMNLDTITLRLYVDGDFSNSQQLKFWMNSLKALPKVKAYGYSKSIPLFIELLKQGFNFPNNYRLNQSNGGKFDNSWQELESMENAFFVRGRFLAVPLNGKRSGHNRTKKDRQDIKTTVGNQSIYKERTGRNYFVCPGDCGKCTNKGHACGIDQFKNIDILIPIH